jgi:uncharacterized protein (DUF433 family)
MPVATIKKRRPAKKRKVYGQYIVADPEICHGQLTFIGTRIFVADVLAQAARGMNWNTIVKAWRGRVSREAIAEALEFSRQALLDHIDEYTVKPPRNWFSRTTT